MLDHVQTCTVEQIVDMLVPEIMEESVGVMTLIPQERVQSYIVEQVFDVLVQGITEEHRRRRQYDLPWTCFWEDGGTS